MHALPAESPCHALREALQHALQEQVSHSTTGRTVLRAETRVADSDLLLWLQAQQGWTQYYWKDRDGRAEMAGIGEAHVVIPDGPLDLVRLFQSLRAVLPQDEEGPRFYGGFRFHDGPVKGERWKRFKAYRFVVPRFELCRRGSATHFACNVLLGKTDSHQNILEKIGDDLDHVQFGSPIPDIPLPEVTERTDTPDREAWENLVQDTLGALELHELSKIVLARETCFQTASPIDPIALLRRLCGCAPDTFTFCFHPVPDRAFLGASPERLYRRTGVHVESEALAGTRPRHPDADRDAALANDLLNSAKDLHEHAIVVESILDSLVGLCPTVEATSRPAVMRLAHVQHLHTPIRGLLRCEDSDAALVAALHPTPAVGGAPRGPALDWIAQHEPFDRGIYAAPVGWVGADAAEFCVAIRSGLVQDDTLTLYNGAGIVPGSAPEDEWEEIECKMAAFLEALGGSAAVVGHAPE